MTQAPNFMMIGGQWIEGRGDEFVSTSPSSGQIVWCGRAATEGQVEAAFAAARAAFGPWWDQTLDQRIAICQRFAELVKERSEELARLISFEMGKTLWESRSEAATVVAKIAVSLEALRARRDISQFEMSGLQAVTRYKPFGVMAVLGPFNFPAHLPNGHIVPALMAGNTVVFKPSEQTPAVGAWMVKVWQDAGIPTGVINLVQGGREVGIAVSQPERCDGLLFTGSGHVGRALHKAFADFPQKILALEMGGNNPLIIDQVGDLNAAAYQTVLSAFITSGQRCTCARRLILVREGNDIDATIHALQQMTKRLAIGYFDDTVEPFYGPVINQRAGEMILQGYEALLAKGGRPLATMSSQRDNPALLTPALVDVSEVSGLEDEEIFGPLLTLQVADNLDAAIQIANDTKYGLSAGLFSDDPERYRHFIHRIRAGIVNWNRQTTGASGKLPFGGCGQSGNSRPAGYFSADYCSFPVASLESSTLTMPQKLEPGISQ
jgi:succinylglutamic semialdehyde dehydrogenase